MQHYRISNDIFVKLINVFVCAIVMCTRQQSAL